MQYDDLGYPIEEDILSEQNDTPELNSFSDPADLFMDFMLG